MTTPTTYFDVHLLFLFPPIAGLGFLAWRRSVLDRRFLGAVAILTVLAVGYTTPWDARLIAVGVWWYGDGSVSRRFLGVPLGEYAFFLLQSVVTLLWVGCITRGDRLRVPARPSRSDRIVGFLAGVSVGVGGWLLLAGPRTWLYLGAILLWAGPVLAIQWAYDWPSLRRRRWPLTVGVLVPTGYLCLVDRVAIDAGVWNVSRTYTTGLTVGGLPVEEAVFFLVTNVFLVQGYLLYDDLLDRREIERPTAEDEG
ncbi:lycopene cyclase domain-containing protein [Halopenitus malekzadehii]|uniref:Lycopene cyclase domain-containing protein n=1 Tax=Halopenitus malekzadehii TaxID=1267564 RepID=A0A1H6HT83_9EURY|nr:lycopene cyclase domain-containing protein [Halopenitus malekzadehii]SEH39236.1 lycopene cyclase domain-containing protein [Halopenitus malekzadehii]